MGCERVLSVNSLREVPAGTTLLAICRSSIPSETCNFAIRGKKAETPEKMREFFDGAILDGHCLYLGNYAMRRFHNKSDVPEFSLDLLKERKKGDELGKKPIGYYLGLSLKDNPLQKLTTIWEIYIVKD